MKHVEDMAIEGVSGSVPGQRKDLEELLKRKREKNDFDVLMIQIADRMTRGGVAHGFWFEHECLRHGIILYYVGEEHLTGPYADVIRAMKYGAAREYARLLSLRSVQGAVFALTEGRNTPTSHTPFGCWRLYLSADGTPLYYIRNVGDGRQQKLHIETRQVIDTFGSIGGGSKGHYRKQKSESVFIAPGDKEGFTLRSLLSLMVIRSLWG